MDTYYLSEYHKNRSAGSKVEMDTRTHMYHKTWLVLSNADTDTNTRTQYHKNRSIWRRVEMHTHTKQHTHFITHTRGHALVVV
jgi:2-methylcitrate dehydratase PrpD